MRILRSLWVFALVAVVALAMMPEASPRVVAENRQSGKVSSSLSLRIKLKQNAVVGKGGHSTASRGADVQPAAGDGAADGELLYLYFASQPGAAELSQISSLGVSVYADSWVPPVGRHTCGFLLARGRLDKVDALAALPYIVQVDTAESRSVPQNDQAEAAIGVAPVWSLGVDGTGVTVAVIDSGIDITNRDFPPIDSTNSADYSNYPDSVDSTVANTVTPHGTHVAGSLLGRGVNSTTYRGVAPGARLVFLKVGNDTDGKAKDAAICRALVDAATVYHASIINLSYGTWRLYHDGTDAVCQAVDYVTARGATVFVAAGDFGNRAWHYSGSVSANATTADIVLNVSGAASYLSADLVWSDSLSVHNRLSLQYFDGSHNPLPVVSGSQSESGNGVEAIRYVCESAVPPGVYYLRVSNNSTADQVFHIYYMGESDGVRFERPDPNYTLASPADADGAVAVGAAVTRTQWTNYRGQAFSSGQSGGTLAGFSSRGPRVDDPLIVKPDVVAPGSAIISVRDAPTTAGLEADMYVIDDDGRNLNGSGPAHYYVMQGTSMAAPFAAGVAALTLSHNSTLNAGQLKHVIEKSARLPVGASRDQGWGWGLINASLAVNITGPSVFTYSDPVSSLPCYTFSSENRTVYLRGSGYLGGRYYTVAYYDGAGRLVAFHTMSSGGSGDINDQFLFSPGAAPGLWHALVCEWEYRYMLPELAPDSPWPMALSVAEFELKDLADAAHSVLAPLSANVSADGRSTVLLRVEANTARGSRVTTGGDVVAITLARGSGMITPVRDNGDGTYSATVTAPSAPGSGVFVATLNGRPVMNGGSAQAEATISYVTPQAARLAFVTQPGDGTAGAALSRQPVVALRDASGNIVASSVPVTLSIKQGSGAPGAVLNGSATVTASNGLAVFSNVGVSLAGSAYVLTASSPGLGSSDSATFNVLPYSPPPPPPAVAPPVLGGGWSAQPSLSPGEIDLSLYQGYDGIFNLPAMLKSEDSMLELSITKGVLVRGVDGAPLKKIKIWPMAEAPELPLGEVLVGKVYEIGPTGATFTPEVTLTLFVDLSKVPSNIDFRTIAIASFNPVTAAWSPIESIFNREQSTVTARLSHLSGYAVMVKELAPPTTTAYVRTPASFRLTGAAVRPQIVAPDQGLTVYATVSNTGGTGGTYEVALTVDGQMEGVRSVYVAAGSSVDVSFGISSRVPGLHEIEVGGLKASFTVSQPLPLPATTPAVSYAPASASQSPTTGMSGFFVIAGALIVGFCIILGTVIALIRTANRTNGGKRRDK